MRIHVLEHMRICMEMEMLGLAWKVKSGHSDREMLAFLDEVWKAGLGDVVKSMGNALVGRLICDTGFCQVLQWLLEEGIALARIEQFALCAGEEVLSSCDYIGMSSVLGDKAVPDDDTWLYFRWYLGKGYSDRQKESLAAGLDYYRKTFRTGLEEWTEEERALLAEPCFSSPFYGAYQGDAWQLLGYHKNPQFLSCMNGLAAVVKEHYSIGEEQVRQIAAAPAEIESGLETVLKMVPEEEAFPLVRLWLNNKNLLYDLKRMCHVFAGRTPGENAQAAAGRVSYMALIYGTDLGSITNGWLHPEKEAVLIYALANGKKHFLKLIQGDQEAFDRLPSGSILFQERFYRRYVNLNTLGRKNLAHCAVMTSLPDASLMANDSYTFEEIACLCRASEPYIRLYHQLGYPRVDDRLRVFREVAKKQCLPGEMSDAEIAALGRHLTEKPLSAYLHGDFSAISNLKATTAVLLLAHLDELGRFTPELATAQQAECLLRNLEKLPSYQSLSEFETGLLAGDAAWLRMKEAFRLGEAFINENRERILAFLQEGGAEIVMDFCGDDPERTERARRLVTAEVMGKFGELKYYKNDLRVEIDYPVSEARQSQWQQNSQMLGKCGVKVWEEDHFLPVMRVGEIPVQTCISYKDGMHKDCLLSCFDANKKIIFASKDDKVCFRAILRLTKGGCQPPEEMNAHRMEFADLTRPETADRGTGGAGELLLFLERPYYKWLSDGELGQVMEAVVDLAEGKAERMGAGLVLNDAYRCCLKRRDKYVRTRYSIYISRSKNGRQYLDSLGGAASVNDSDGYREGMFFIRENTIYSGKRLTKTLYYAKLDTI